MRRPAIHLVMVLLPVLAGCGGGGKDAADRHDASDGPRLIPIVENRKWGFIDLEGTTVVSPQYELVDGFVEGRARVLADGFWGFLDETGRMAIEPKFDSVVSFNEGLAAVGIGGAWGYIDTSGTPVVPIRYQHASKFSEGLGCVRENDLYGFVDRSGAMVIEPRFAAPGTFESGIARMTDDGKRWAFLLPDGTLLNDTWYEGTEVMSEDIAGFKQGGKWGYLRRTGEILVEPRFDFVGPFVDGIARAGIPTRAEWEFLDADGRTVIPPGYDMAMNFSEGLAPVRKDGRWGLIDAQNRVVYDFADQVAFMGFDHGLCAIRIGEKWGFLDRSLKVVIPPQFDEVGHFHGPYAPARNGKTRLYIRRDGTVLWQER